MKSGTRVLNIYTRETGTVDYELIPGYVWVNWDDGNRFPVSTDALDEIEVTA